MLTFNLTSTKGGVLIYSPEDHETIMKHKWHRCDKDGYITTNSRDKTNGKTVRIHRLLMNCPEDKIVDHINGNILDNRRENLRIVDPSDNAQNKRKSTKKKFTSKYIGVCLDSRNNTWRAEITINKKNIGLGIFLSETEAAEQRDCYIVQRLPNSYYNLNFPEKKEVYKTKVLTLPTPKPQKKSEAKIKSFVENIIDKPDIVRLLIPSKQDAIVTISKDDYNKIKYHNCHISKGYVCTTKNIRLHRFLMDETNPKVIIDHIDNNPLNNTRQNLRRSDLQKNSQNRKKSTGKSSKNIGVSFSKNRHKWQSHVFHQGKNYSIGYYDDEEEAGKAHDLFILKNFPNSHHTLNFIPGSYDVSKIRTTRLKPKSSKYIGVSWDSNYQKWIVGIYDYINKKSIMYKSFDNEIEAAQWRNKYIIDNREKLKNYKLNEIIPEPSKYIGVIYNKKIKKWIVKIDIKNKKILRKTFTNEIDAAKYRNEFILKNANVLGKYNLVLNNI
jgi:hypothetical protein